MLEIEQRYKEFSKHDRIRVENWVTFNVLTFCYSQKFCARWRQTSCGREIETSILWFCLTKYWIIGLRRHFWMDLQMEVLMGSQFFQKLMFKQSWARSSGISNSEWGDLKVSKKNYCHAVLKKILIIQKILIVLQVKIQKPHQAVEIKVLD